MSAADIPLTLPVRELLRQSTLFRHLDDDELAALEQLLEWFVLPGGATLFEFGDTSDALYLLRSAASARSAGMTTARSRSASA